MAEQSSSPVLLPVARARVRTPPAGTCAGGCCPPVPSGRAADPADDCCAPPAHPGETAEHPEHPAPSPVRDAAWLRSARLAKVLAWASLTWMTVEGVLGLFAGIRAGSVGLVGWALSSVVEGLASVIVIWRFSGTRTHSAHAEGTAQRAIAVSFWLLAPYIGVQAVVDLLGGAHPSASSLGITLTISSIVVMPVLGIAKRRLGRGLGSGATAGEGTQNLLCAYLAAGVLAGLVADTALGWWWVDPLAGLAVAAAALLDGRRAWRGEDCC